MGSCASVNSRDTATRGLVAKYAHTCVLLTRSVSVRELRDSLGYMYEQYTGGLTDTGSTHGRTTSDAPSQAAFQPVQPHPTGAYKPKGPTDCL